MPAARPAGLAVTVTLLGAETELPPRLVVSQAALEEALKDTALPAIDRFCDWMLPEGAAAKVSEVGFAVRTLAFGPPPTFRLTGMEMAPPG